MVYNMRDDPFSNAGKNKKRGFVKGHKHATGRPKLPPDIRAVRNLNRDEALVAICSTMTVTYAQLEAQRENPLSTAAELIAARICMAAIDDGCYFSAQFLMNYIIGKPVPYDPLADDQASNATMVFKTSVSQDGSILQALLDEEEKVRIIEQIDNG